MAYAIAALDVFVFAHEIAIEDPARRDAFIASYALIPYDLTHGLQPHGFPLPAFATLVTSQFLHASVLHIACNLLFFVVFAPEIEALVGHVRFAAFYLACGVLGGLAQVSVATGSHVPSIGASGAIAGVLGAYIVRFPTRAVFDLPAFLVIGLWAAVQFIHGFAPLSERVLSEQGGGTAYFAHIGGFLAGVILVGAFARGRVRSPGGRPRASYTRS